MLIRGRIPELIYPIKEAVMLPEALVTLFTSSIQILKQMYPIRNFFSVCKLNRFYLQIPLQYNSRFVLFAVFWGRISAIGLKMREYFLKRRFFALKLLPY